MTGEQILTMFFGEMGDSVLDIECLVLAGLDSPGANTGVLCWYPLDMLGVAIHLLHDCYRQTRAEERMSIEKDARTRKDPKGRGEKGPVPSGKKGTSSGLRDRPYIQPLHLPNAGWLFHAKFGVSHFFGDVDWICFGGGDKEDGPCVQRAHPQT
jgi:hypothetical protein